MSYQEFVSAIFTLDRLILLCPPGLFFNAKYFCKFYNFFKPDICCYKLISNVIQLSLLLHIFLIAWSIKVRQQGNSDGIIEISQWKEPLDHWWLMNEWIKLNGKFTEMISNKLIFCEFIRKADLKSDGLHSVWGCGDHMQRFESAICKMRAGMFFLIETRLDCDLIRHKYLLCSAEETSGWVYYKAYLLSNHSEWAFHSS
jgi:hypothetical protein